MDDPPIKKSWLYIMRHPFVPHMLRGQLIKYVVLLHTTTISSAGIFNAPWCGNCKKLAPILDEIAISFEKDDDVVITKLDATANDILDDTFDAQGYPTIYLRTSSGNLVLYEGDRSKEDIIEFIQKNREQQATQTAEETYQKDELQ